MNQNMMINLEGLDIFNGTSSIEIAPLTILTGLNNSGKTTILNAIEKQCKHTKRWKWSGMSLMNNPITSEIGDTLLFEQPEAGLHPKMQLYVMDYLLSWMLLGKTVVVETHSDHMINRISRRILENHKLQNKVIIYFLDNGQPDKITVDMVKGIITSNKKFFSEFSDETEQILLAGYRNKEKQSKQTLVREMKLDPVRGFLDAPDDFFSQFGTESTAIFEASINNMEHEKI